MARHSELPVQRIWSGWAWLDDDGTYDGQRGGEGPVLYTTVEEATLCCGPRGGHAVRVWVEAALEPTAVQLTAQDIADEPVYPPERRRGP